jgi:hypothetical protein
MLVIILVSKHTFNIYLQAHIQHHPDLRPKTFLPPLLSAHTSTPNSLFFFEDMWAYRCLSQDRPASNTRS